MLRRPLLAWIDLSDEFIARCVLDGRNFEKESLEQAKLQDAIARYDYEQQKPYLKLNQYLGSIGANVPMTTAQTQPVFRNTGAGLLGGAMTGAKIGGMEGFDPLLGAIGGGLLGGYA